MVNASGLGDRAEQQVKEIEASILLYNELLINDSAELELKWVEEAFEVSIGSTVIAQWHNGIETIEFTGELVGVSLDIKGGGASVVVRNPSNVVRGAEELKREEWIRERYCAIEEVLGPVSGRVNKEISVLINFSEKFRTSYYSYNLVR